MYCGAMSITTFSNVNKCKYVVGQHNGDLRLF